MEESIPETKPVIGVETSADSSSDAVINDKTDSTLNQTNDNKTVAQDLMDDNEEAVVDSDEHRLGGDDKMDVELSAVDADKDLPQISVESEEPKVAEVDDNSNSNVLKSVPNDNDVSVAVEETNGVELPKAGQSPAVEPVPDVGVKSPDVLSVIDKITSPSPVPSATPPRVQSSKKPKVDLTTVPVRQYLDTTVVPILLQGLSSLARERPQKPIAFLANFLLEKASEYDEE